MVVVGCFFVLFGLSLTLRRLRSPWDCFPHQATATQLRHTRGAPWPSCFDCFWKVSTFEFVCFLFVSWTWFRLPFVFVSALGGSFVAGRSHGLGCTTASGIGADQYCSLPDSPGRPCAAKSASMARFRCCDQIVAPLCGWVNRHCWRPLLVSQLFYWCSATLQSTSWRRRYSEGAWTVWLSTSQSAAPPAVQRFRVFLTIVRLFYIVTFL